MIQSKTQVIGLTGGISTGKSTVTNILRKKGFKVIDADLIAKEVLNVGEDAYVKVIEFFGEDILNFDKSINRKTLGNKIFKEKILREKLNSLTHPYIMTNIKKEISKYNEEKILFLDIPLLLEVYDSLVDNEIFIDKVWLVYCDREKQIERLMKRDNISHESAELKVKAQMDIEKKRKLSDEIIDNTRDNEDLKKNVEIVLEKIF